MQDRGGEETGVGPGVTWVRNQGAQRYAHRDHRALLFSHRAPHHPIWRPLLWHWLARLPQPGEIFDFDFSMRVTMN